MRSPVARIAVVAATVAVLVVLFLVLRPDGDAEPARTTAARTGSAPGTTATTPTTAATTTTDAAPTGPRRIRVSVAGGRVAGGVRTVEVARGERIVVVVRADVSDHVHVHGYDRFADVAPGAPAQIGLRATIAGRFEVELEDRRLRILELEVRP